MKSVLNGFIVLPLFILFGCTSKPVPTPNIIPRPNKLQQEKGFFILKEDSRVSISEPLLKQEGELLCGWISGRLEQDDDAEIQLRLDSMIRNKEGYHLSISEKNVTIVGRDPVGIFYGLQTFRQLLPESIEKGVFTEAVLPALDIEDEPRFSWRGMHLDVSRHFMPKEFVKRYIDYLAMHKLNVFHWHLVDGIGWRIEMKKYPRLTDWGAWRVVKDSKPWVNFEVWKPGDTRPKDGGFYSHEDIKEIVEYAKVRHITILPEIELPGHSNVVFDCFPELICENNGERLKNIGVYCAGNDEVFSFLDDIIDEVLELFPSEYIHIGGDEVNKANWKVCSKCQSAMRKHDLKDLHELQSYFINHFDEYLSRKGRKLIGWHEILDGNLSPNATIMYWGGETGVAETLKKGHNTVLTTCSHLYFDHYQGLSKIEPKAWGGFSNLTKVYNYEPISDEIPPNDAKRILGVQANVWTEHMPTPEHVEYMIFPRMSALSEITWTSKENKNWVSYKRRISKLLKRYDAMDINVSKSAYIPQIEVLLDTVSKLPNLKFSTELDVEVHYTINGNTPDKESALFDGADVFLEQSAMVKVVSILDGEVVSPVEELYVNVHKGRGAKVEFKSSVFKSYSAKGGITLVDLERGGNKWGNGRWIGVLNKDFDAIIDLGSKKEIIKVGFGCIEETASGIYYPAKVNVYGSNDGVAFKAIGEWSRVLPDTIIRTTDIKTDVFNVKCDKNEYRYLRVMAQTLYGLSQDQGTGVFIFVDEILIE